MCGRYSLVLSEEELREHFAQAEIDHHWRKSYNIAPTHHSAVITNDRPSVIQRMEWGLVPYWSNSPQNKGKLINARMEGIESRPSFRVPFRERRCLVLADSYYEWKSAGGMKQPYRIMLTGSPLMVMAGLWDVWELEGYSIKTFSIITAPASQDVARLHYRMPVILDSKEKQEAWLSDLSLTDSLHLLGTLPSGKLKMYPVTPKLNAVNFNEPACHIELPERPDLFSGQNEKA